MIIKCHMLMHLPMQWNRKVNCWVTERKHKHAKRFANEVTNTAVDWDKSVLREVTSAHISRLSGLPADEYTGGVRLVASRPPSPALRRTLIDALGDFPDGAFATSLVAHVDQHGERASVSDVVLLQQRDAAGAAAPSMTIGQVLWHVSVSDAGHLHVLTCVREWSIDEEQTRCFKCRRSENTIVVPTQWVIAATVWAGKEDGILTVLKPLHALANDGI